MAEIALFALSARLPSTITPLAMLLVGAAGAVVRWSAMAAAPPAILLPALQCLHALSFGATHLGALALVARMAPPGLGATAQGYFAVALGVTMAVATALAGVLYGRFGSGAYAPRWWCWPRRAGSVRWLPNAWENKRYRQVRYIDVSSRPLR
jgi:PPP family 3-phenylpropionic acid transporter